MSDRQIEQTYYEILELNADAPHHEVVKAYERAKIAYAPDSPALYTMFTEEEARDIRKLIEEAFRVLGNQARRKEYDHVLLARKNEAASANLPDFGPIKETAPKSGPSEKQPNAGASPKIESAVATGTVPAGFAKSRFGVYEIKKDIELEIANEKEFSGAFFRKVRMYKNINIDQLSKETKIGRTYIAAIESEDFEALPAPVFVRGFIVQLARILGFDENLAANTYMQKVKIKE